MYSPFSITELSAISVFEKTYQNDRITDEFTSYFLLLSFIWKSKTLLSFDKFFQPFNALKITTNFNHEMLRVAEHIQQIARTDRIKKILTGCVRVTETASHDGEVVFILIELK